MQWHYYILEVEKLNAIYNGGMVGKYNGTGRDGQTGLSWLQRE